MILSTNDIRKTTKKNKQTAHANGYTKNKQATNLPNLPKPATNDIRKTTKKINKPHMAMDIQKISKQQMTVLSKKYKETTNSIEYKQN